MKNPLSAAPSRRQKAVVFLLCAAAIFILLYIINSRESVGDAYTYMRDASLFLENGRSNFYDTGKNFNPFHSAYLFPWLLSLACLKGPMELSWVVYWALASLFASLICTIVAPDIAEDAFGVKIGPLRRGALAALFFVFYRGLTMYALSDLWAFGFFALAIRFAVGAGKENPARRRAPVFALVGVFCAMAYYTRPVYLIPSAALFVVMLLKTILDKNAARGEKLVLLSVFLFGFALIGVPQVIVNCALHNRPSFLVVSAEGASLVEQQLWWGVFISKYETPNVIGYPYTACFYYDEAGLLLAQKAGIADSVQEMGGISGYLKLVLKYPLDFLGIYGRHTVNILDMRYPEVYIKNIDSSVTYPLINYLLLYFGIASTVSRIKTAELGLVGFVKKRCMLLVMILPAVFAIPGAVETRFALPLHIALWVSALGVSADELKEVARSRSSRWLFAVGFIVFVTLFCAIAGDAVAVMNDLPGRLF